MTQRSRPYEPSTGIFYAIGGAALLAIGGAIAAATTVDQERMLGLVVVGFGLYLIVTGAVARGIQMGRQAAPTDVPD